MGNVKYSRRRPSWLLRTTIIWKLVLFECSLPQISDVLANIQCYALRETRTEELGQRVTRSLCVAVNLINDVSYVWHFLIVLFRVLVTERRLRLAVSLRRVSADGWRHLVAPGCQVGRLAVSLVADGVSLQQERVLAREHDVLINGHRLPMERV